jgi:hypothetical protein
LLRYCYVCSSGGNPEQTACVLCSNSGGAYKATNVPGVWAHGLCATWIPEVFATDHTGRILNIDYLDPKRERLKCSLCSSKGTCVQCAYGRCTTAVHPWCCLTNPRGYTHRIVKNEKDETVWEIFCKAHAYAVHEPIKPKPKAKSQAIVMKSNTYDNDSDGMVGYSSESKFGNENTSKLKRKSSNSRMVDSSSDEEDAGVGITKRMGKGKAPMSAGSNEHPTSNSMSSSQAKASQFLTLSEWPGQAEGEGLDLDHFWNFASSAFPEDHPSDVSQCDDSDFLCTNQSNVYSSGWSLC